jgi:hypothetical protein
MRPRPPFGSMLKGYQADWEGKRAAKEPEPKVVSKKAAKKKSERSTKHLAALRQLPCLACGCDPCGEAAHVRMGSQTGLGKKPSDYRAIPLCHEDHMLQHARGEEVWWAERGHTLEAVVAIAAQLERASPDVKRMRKVIDQARK